MADKDFTLSKEYLNLIFEYKKGKLFRKINVSNAKTGDEAGYLNKRLGYLYVYINNKNYRVHRIIFMMHHGYVPNLIDHIDGDKLNNKIENLRQATKSENYYNSKIRKDNSSGVNGVCFDKVRKKWCACAVINGKKKYIGRFADIESAKNAIVDFKKLHHKDFFRNS